MLAATFYYDMDMATVIRFLGNNYTGEYRNSEDIIAIFKETKCDKDVVKDLQRLYNVGAPHKLNASSSHQNILEIFRYGNHSSIFKNTDKASKTMNN